MLASTCIGSVAVDGKGPNGGTAVSATDGEGGMLILPAAVDVPELCATDGADMLLTNDSAKCYCVNCAIDRITKY